MRKFLTALVFVLPLAAACTLALTQPSGAQGLRGTAARLTGDMAQMLDYQPTDGASRAGDIRRALNPTAVQPR